MSAYVYFKQEYTYDCVTKWPLRSASVKLDEEM